MNKLLKVVEFTTAAVQALLVSARLEPGTLVLPDFEDSTPPANALGLSGGRLSLGDGDTVAGIPLTPRRVAGATLVALNGTNKTGARFAVVPIPITSAESVAGSEVYISGTVKLLFDNAFYAPEDPVISATIGFTHPAYTTQATTKWVSYNCLPTGTEVPFLITNHINFIGLLEANPTAGADKLVIVDANSQIVSDRWAGAAGNTFTKNDAAIDFVAISDTAVAITEETASAIWLCLEIVMGASGTNGDINFSVAYDLTTTITLP